jgi:GntR family transcriptional regulator
MAQVVGHLITFGEVQRLQADTRPLYARAKAAIRDLLTEQAYSPGRRIPTEQVLARELGTSRGTVREALKALEHEGLVTSRRGSGTFVADGAPLAWAGLESLRSTTALLREQRLAPAVRHLRIEQIPADAASAARLGLPSGHPILVIERVRTANGEPVCFVRDEIAGPTDMLSAYRAASPESLLEFLRSEYGISIDHSLCEIRAANAGTALARALQVPRRRALVQMDQVHFDAQRQPVFFSRSHWRTDNFAFRVVRRATD